MTPDADFIPFNRPFLVGTEIAYIESAIQEGRLAGGGSFTNLCEDWLQEQTGCGTAFLTHSGTAALEAAALLAGIGPGDEVVMPSFTFVSTANAFALRGAKPVFADIDPQTLTIDPQSAAAAITPATKAIVAVHYGGVACEMDELRALADRHDLVLIEDAALGLLSSYRGRSVGGIGDLGALSFHQSKNLISGAGGALLVNSPSLREPAEIVLENGTDRRSFERGEVDKYQWVGLGSSFTATEITAAFLWAQFEHAQATTDRRRAVWNRYHEAFADLEAEGLLRRPVIPADRTHNAHTYYLLLSGPESRALFIDELLARQIQAVFHYVPLHTAPGGQRFGRAHGALVNTDQLSARLVRLPLWTAMGEPEVERVIDAVREVANLPASRLDR